MTSEDKSRIIEKMNRMAALLQLGGYNDWSASIRSLANDFESFPERVRSNFLSLYGGMGSLNDLLICINGKISIDENEEFDKIRSELYEDFKWINNPR